MWIEFEYEQQQYKVRIEHYTPKNIFEKISRWFFNTSEYYLHIQSVKDTETIIKLNFSKDEKFFYSKGIVIYPMKTLTDLIKDDKKTYENDLLCTANKLLFDLFAKQKLNKIKQENTKMRITEV